MLKKNTLSIVIPVYNSEKTLPELLSRLEEVLPGICESFEVILVNDGSQDSSWGVISQLSQKNNCVVGINLMRNYGQHNALLCGIRAAKNDIIVTMDDDLQNPPKEIPKLIEKLSEGYDVVYGLPQRQKNGFWRNLASKITNWAFQSVMGSDIRCNTSTFRAFKKRLRDAFHSYQNPYVSIDVLLAWSTKCFGSVQVSHSPRVNGESNYTFLKLIAHALNMLTGFSTLPLQIASIIGFFFTLFGIGVLAYVLGRYFFQGTSVPGFPFLASIIAIFAGVQLFTLGIIGEYLSRMHLRMMGKPTYVVDNKTR